MFFFESLPALSIFVYTAFFCVPILLPISGTDKNLELQSKKNATATFSELDKIAMGNVQVIPIM
jgi:hypothetical protein